MKLSQTQMTPPLRRPTPAEFQALYAAASYSAEKHAKQERSSNPTRGRMTWYSSFVSEPREATRSARRKQRIALNKSHRYSMQQDREWRADLRAWVIKDNLATLRALGFVLP